MRPEQERKKKIVLFAMLLLVIGVGYSVLHARQEKTVAIEGDIDRIVVRYQEQDHELTAEQATKLISLFSNVSVTESKSKSEIGDDEYKESYKLTFYEGEDAKEIYYIFEDQSVYDPSRTTSFKCDKSMWDEMSYYVAE